MELLYEKAEAITLWATVALCLGIVLFLAYRQYRHVVRRKEHRRRHARRLRRRTPPPLERSPSPASPSAG